MLRQFNMLLILFIVHFQTAAFRCSHCFVTIVITIIITITTSANLSFTCMCVRVQHTHDANFYVIFFQIWYVRSVLTNVDFYMKIAFKSLYLSRLTISLLCSFVVFR